MKKILIMILSAITLLLVICLIINSCGNKKKDKVLSVNYANNYSLSNNERRINQVLYFTRDNIYNTTSLVSQISIIDDDLRLNLKLNNIKKTSYTYKYDNDKYYSYVYDLTIPKIEGNLLFSNAKMEIVSDDKTLIVPIGVFELIYDDSTINNINNNALSGLCAYNPYQTLSNVTMKLENKEFSNITIDKVTMGSFIDLVKDEKEEVIFDDKNIVIDEVIIGFMEKELKLYLSYKKRLVLKESFIIIEYSDSLGSHKEIIDTYNFYDNGYLLPNDRTLINKMEFSV